jgi:hypothetical protein
MSAGAQKLALLFRDAARQGAQQRAGGGTVGVVRKASPLTIQPLTGAIALPDEALGWTVTGSAAKAGLQVDDLVLMIMVAGQYYVVDKVDS